MPTSTGSVGPELRDRFRDSYADCDYAALTPFKLAEVTRERGVDFATALLYDRIRRAEPHRALIDTVDAIDPTASLPSTSARLLIAPAAFWREYPQLGSDGAAVLAIARELGISAERIPTHSTGGVTENARILREALVKEADGSVILVSLSKGGADVRVALDDGGAPLRKVRAWINVCGLVHGTPLVDQFFAGPWWRRMWFARSSRATVRTSD
jgi:hypothetical protein